MITRKQFVAATAVAVMSLGAAAVSARPAGQHLSGPIGHGGHGFSPERMAQRMDAMKAALRLTASQQPLWDAYTARVQQQLEAGMKMREQMQAARGNAEQLKQLQDSAFRSRTEAMAEISRLKADLVRTLSVEQTTILRELGPGSRMRAHHERAHDRKQRPDAKPQT
jgi:LTXXQ motif family protein